jgi:hypothetical protein
MEERFNLIYRTKEAQAAMDSRAFWCAFPGFRTSGSIWSLHVSLRTFRIRFSTAVIWQKLNVTNPCT